jgi:hypothetical protein
MTKLQKIWLGIGIVGTFLVILSIYGANQEKKMNEEITQNKGETIGVVIKYGAQGKTIYKDLVYEYFVNGNRYIGSVGETQVKDLEKLCKQQHCPDCVGAKFQVEYSTLNYDYCRVIIGNDTIITAWGFGKGRGNK